MPLIRPINPIPNLQHPIGGTDLGVPFRTPWGVVGLVFGDTFGKLNGQLAPQCRGGDWRAPVIVWTRPIGLGVLSPMAITGGVNGGAQLWAYQHNNPTFSTVLPCDAIVLGQRIHVWVMVSAGLGHEKWCELAYSDNRGATWRNNGAWNTGRFGGKRVMLTFDLKPGAPFIDIFSTGGLARNKSMLRWRVRPGDFLNQARWEGWCFINRKWQWIVNPHDNQPSDILPGWRLGEIGFRWIQGNAILSGFNAGDYSIFVKIAHSTDANWMTARTYLPVTGIPRGVDWLPQCYGGYVHPDSAFLPGFTLIVSNWNTATGNPYQASQYLIVGMLPAVSVEGVEAPYVEEGADLSDAEVNNKHLKITLQGKVIQEPAPTPVDDTPVVLGPGEFEKQVGDCRQVHEEHVAAAAASSIQEEHFNAEQSSIDFLATNGTSQPLISSIDYDSLLAPADEVSADSNPAQSRLRLKNLERSPYGSARAVIGGALDGLVEQLLEKDELIEQLQKQVRDLQAQLAVVGSSASAASSSSSMNSMNY